MSVSKERAIGWRVQVYWEGDDEWFEGTISKYLASKGYYVEYDDGEEQWESETTPIKYLSGPKKDDESEQNDDPVPPIETDTNANRWSAQPPPSTQLTSPNRYDEEEYEEEDPVEPSPVEPSPDPNLRKKEAAQPLPRRMPSQYMTVHSSRVFLQDEESLREMKKALTYEKKELTQEYETMSTQIKASEQTSILLKREIQDLKAQVTLATLNVSAKAHAYKPKTAADWAERVQEQKQETKTLKQQMATTQTTLYEQKRRIQKLEQQREELQTRLARVPRRELCSLVDLQLEMAQMIQEKRRLEAEVARLPISSSRRRGEKEVDQQQVKLETELKQYDQQIARIVEATEQWKFSYERENARIRPLQDRLNHLQAELSQYASSQVLLRSVFLRMDQAKTGMISLETAIKGYTLLAPPSSPIDHEIMRKQLEPLVDKDNGLDFTHFVQGFKSLFQ